MSSTQEETQARIMAEFKDSQFVLVTGRTLDPWGATHLSRRILPERGWQYVNVEYADMPSPLQDAKNMKRADPKATYDSINYNDILQDDNILSGKEGIVSEFYDRAPTRTDLQKLRKLGLDKKVKVLIIYSQPLFRTIYSDGWSHLKVSQIN